MKGDNLKKGEDFGMVGAERVWGNLFSMHIYVSGEGGRRQGWREEMGNRR